MIKIGLTQISATQVANESYSDKFERQENIEYTIKQSISGQKNVVGMGRKLKVFTRTFTGLTRAEYENIRQYCSPYIFSEVWVEVSSYNWDNTLFAGFAFVEMVNESNSEDDQNYNFDLVIHEI